MLGERSSHGSSLIGAQGNKFVNGEKIKTRRIHVSSLTGSQGKKI